MNLANSMNEYEVNRQWSDKYTPTIIRLTGWQLLKPAPPDVDMKQATDLIILTAHDLKIACRIRRPGFAERYPNQFTLRCYNGGYKTELEKIISGWGDWFFYGHAKDEQSHLIEPYWLIDLESFRYHYRFNHDVLVTGQRDNSDRKTKFIWFQIDSFPTEPALIIDSSGRFE